MIEFAAVVALTGVATRGGWYLAPLEEGAPVPRSRDLPLPVTGQQLPQRERGGGSIGWVEHLRCMQGAVVARGFLDSTAEGRDHAGALKLGMTRIVMEGETAAWSYDDRQEQDVSRGPVCCTEWRISGASVQMAPAWDLPVAHIDIRGMV